MQKGHTSVFGIFDNRAGTENCVNELVNNGFRAEDISVLTADQSMTKDMAAEKGTKAPEGTAAGATTGGVVGGALGLLAGIGAIAIPGVGPFIAAGPIMGTLAGVGAGAATGGLIGALIGIGMPEYEAKRYEGQIRKGGFLLSVHCDDSDWCDKAEDILERTGAHDVSSSSEESVKKAG